VQEESSKQAVGDAIRNQCVSNQCRGLSRRQLQTTDDCTDYLQ